MRRRMLGLFGPPQSLDTCWWSGAWAVSSSWSWGGYQGGLEILVVALAGWTVACLICRHVSGTGVGVRSVTPGFGVGRPMLGITVTLGLRDGQGGAPCR